jgi:hypothetical protein
MTPADRLLLEAAKRAVMTFAGAVIAWAAAHGESVSWQDFAPRRVQSAWVGDAPLEPGPMEGLPGGTGVR